MTLDPGKMAFVEEARELLGEVEEAVLELEGDPDNLEQLGRLFRSMHTIKGSGGMFGFEEIARLTHEAETVFDKVRSRDLAISTGLLNAALAAKDHILELLKAADPTERFEATDALIAVFKELAGGAPQAVAKAAQAPACPAPTAPIPPPAGPSTSASAAASDPPVISASAKAAPGGAHTYWIRFRPAPDTFLTGANPLGLIEELGELGTLYSRYHGEDIPGLEDLNPETAYGWWDLLLLTDQGENAIGDVFIFVAGDCGLSVQRMGAHAIRSCDVAEYFGLIDKLTDLPPLEVAAQLAESFAKKVAMRATPRPEQPPPKADKEEKAGQIRVDAERLDSLVNLVGELVIVQSRMAQAVHSKNENALRDIAEDLSRLTSEMRDHALGIRMVPIGSIYSALRRLVRDLSASMGKDINFVSEGAKTELDKNVIDRLKDPLVHILRNSADHGIESPRERQAAGKPEKGTIVLTAGHESGSVVITIKDDGGGIDPERVRAKAVEKGLIAPDAELTREQIYDLLFAPGFSTAKTVSNVSGRGVGMDVVRKNIEALRGEVSIESAVGRGTVLTVRLPLTLAIIDGLQVRVGESFFIIPLPMVQACQERPVTGEEAEVDVMEMRGNLIPCLSLRRMLGIKGPVPPRERVIITGVDGSLVGLAVDAVVGQQQTVIKSLSRLYRKVNWVSGTTINGDGGISLILDMPQIVRFAALKSGVAQTRRAEGLPPPVQPPAPA